MTKLPEREDGGMTPKYGNCKDCAAWRRGVTLVGSISKRARVGDIQPQLKPGFGSMPQTAASTTSRRRKTMAKKSVKPERTWAVLFIQDTPLEAIRYDQVCSFHDTMMDAKKSAREENDSYGRRRVRVVQVEIKEIKR